MTGQLRRPGIKERVSQLGYLLKHTFAIVGKDPGIVRPWVRMTLYAVVMSSCFFLAIALLALGKGLVGTLLLLLAFSLFLYKYFYYVRQELRQSWLVAEALQGRSRDASSAGQRVAELASTARGIAWIDLLMSGLVKFGLQRGKVGRLLGLVLRGLIEVWDLVNHYLLPSTAVDSHGIKDGISRMQRLKESVPETLGGVFGIDIAARAVGTIMSPIYAIMVILALLLGIWLGDAVPAFYAGDLMQNVEASNGVPLPETLHFSWLPLLIALWIGKLFSVVLERVTTSVKVIYFTIFYMRITHAEDILPEIRDELEAYLRMEAEEVEPVAAPQRGMD